MTTETLTNGDLFRFVTLTHDAEFHLEIWNHDQTKILAIAGMESGPCPPSWLCVWEGSAHDDDDCERTPDQSIRVVDGDLDKAWVQAVSTAYRFACYKVHADK